MHTHTVQTFRPMLIRITTVKNVWTPEVKNTRAIVRDGTHTIPRISIRPIPAKRWWIIGYQRKKNRTWEIIMLQHTTIQRHPIQSCAFQLRCPHTFGQIVYKGTWLYFFLLRVILLFIFYYICNIRHFLWLCKTCF